MQSSSQPTTVRPRSSVRRGPPWWLDLVIGGAAVVCALITWLPARVAGADLTVRDGTPVGHQVTGPAVALAAAVAAAVALSALRILERITPRALRWWIGLGLLVLIASALLGPLGATSKVGVGTLLGLHAVVAAVVLVGGWRAHRRVSTVRGPQG